VPLILDGGPCRVGLESTIVDLSRGAPVVLRPGAIGAADIARVTGLAATAADADRHGPAPRASGLLARHYAPRTPAELVDTAALAARLAQLHAQGLRVGVLALRRPLGDGIALDDEPAAYGQRLYAALRELDGGGFDRLLIETPPPGEAWRAVHDRLRRAVA
jgi:L-threonylcarbamoyladenylate synthase